MIGLRNFRVVSADARRGGTPDEALRVFACEAIKRDTVVILVRGFAKMSSCQNKSF